ncbi:hypothetical protein HanIR_Chr17g0863581 [Helianthus annuus]|nr:hypothetical protein HanIR_Chr17g0863581 [Helianthus annuus]
MFHGWTQERDSLGGLSDAIGMARLVEEKLKLGRVPDSSKEPPATGFLGPAPTPQLALPAPNFVQRLTSAEICDHHAKGLCYYCDATYKSGHRCSKP